MKQIAAILFLLFYLSACNSSDRYAAEKSESDVDAARNFINASLAGDFHRARNYMLRDSSNDELMNHVERVHLAEEEKKGLAAASINIHNVRKLNDSATVVIYSNSYKNNWDTLKVIKHDGEWLVDFNYLFDHDNDSLSSAPMLKTDSLPQ
jgi:hypothetical protein